MPSCRPSHLLQCERHGSAGDLLDPSQPQPDSLLSFDLRSALHSLLLPDFSAAWKETPCPVKSHYLLILLDLRHSNNQAPNPHQTSVSDGQSMADIVYVQAQRWRFLILAASSSASASVTAHRFSFKLGCELSASIPLCRR